MARRIVLLVTVAFDGSIGRKFAKSAYYVLVTRLGQ